MKAKTLFLLFGLLISATLCFSQYTLTLQPGTEGKDAIVSDFYPVGYGEHTNNYAMAGTSGGVPFVCRFLLEFDLSDLPSPCWVVDARLSLYYANDPYNPHTHYGDNWTLIQRVTEPWEELEVSWWNQPPVTTEDQLRIPPSTSPTQDYTDLDLTALVNKWVDEPDSNFGMLVRIETEVMYRRVMFASGDYVIDPAKRPKLEITYLLCEPPEASFTFETSGLTASFAGAATSALTWHWDFGDGDTSNLQNPVHTYLEQGFYTVCLTVEDSCYFDQYCAVVEVCTEPPLAAFDYIADGLTVDFDNQTPDAGEYLWDFGDGEESTEESPVHTYDIPGTYMVCLTAWNSCGEDSVCTVISVCVNPQVGFYYYQYYQEVQFWEYCFMTEQFHWDFGDGHTSKYSNPVHTYDSAGTYYVCLSAINSCGTEEYCEWVYVGSVGVTEEKEKVNDLQIYPNPASDRLTIVGKHIVDRIAIYDLFGRMVMEIDEMGENPVTVDVSRLPPGMYLIRLFGSDGSEPVSKFMKID